MGNRKLRLMRTPITSDSVDQYCQKTIDNLAISGNRYYFYAPKTLYQSGG